jgi:anhydro-N-acetylmuramic acid kinase
MTSAAEDLFVGAISGTSMDGIDLAVLRNATSPAIEAGRTAPFTETLRHALADLAHGRVQDLDALGAAHAALGDAIGRAILSFLDDLGLDPGKIRAIGSHGQTVRHRPEGDLAFSLQIGDANRIAEITGIDTIADFRGRDVAAGGQGAPLVPMFHQVLFGGAAADRAVLNIGGIANLTLLSSNTGRPLSGFDTGPGNALLDAWVEQCMGQSFDTDGAWSAGGAVAPALLKELAEDPYFTLPPPKSTGKEHFNLGWFESRIGGIDPQDVQATLAQLSTDTVATALLRWGSARGELIVCGGGRLNLDLMRRLAQALPDHSIQPCETLGLSGDWIEAAAFAWLAARHIARQPGNSAEVTGAAGPRVLGALYPANVRQ